MSKENKELIINQTVLLKLEAFQNNVHDGETEILQKVEKFVEDFTVQNLKKLQKEKYVYGLGSKDTFCYRITHELKKWGSIRNGTPNKYGFYYNPNQKQYCVVSKFGSVTSSEELEKAYKNVIESICQLIVDGGNGEYKKIQDNKLSTLFKMKLLCVYYPEKYLNVYSKEHMQFYMDILNIPYSKDEGYMKWNEKIINWKNENSIAKEWSNHEFSKFLYKELGYPPDREQQKKRNRKNEKRLDDILKEEIEDLLEKSTASEFEYVPKPENRTIPILSGGNYSYPRNKNVSMQALMRAKYQCEAEKKGEKHPSFIRKSNNTNYTETHHLIPLSEQDKFEYSLDVQANIISLCSNCHNQLHYGKEKEELIKSLYEKRIDELIKAGLEISLEELILMYA